jgi:hypothetical protein
MVGVVWGWVGSGSGGRGPRRAPCGPVPAGPQRPAGADRKSSKGRPGRGPAEQSSSGSGFGSPSGRPNRRAGRPAGWLSAAPAILEVRPSDSSGRRPSAAAAGVEVSPSVRIDWPAVPQAGWAQHQQFCESVRPSRRVGQVAGRPSAAATGLEVRPSESSGRRPSAAAADPEVRPSPRRCLKPRGGRGVGGMGGVECGQGVRFGY